LKAEEPEIIREWANQALRDAKGAKILTDEVLNCSIRLLHKRGDTIVKPSDWRPIGLLNVCIQLVHHVINYRLDGYHRSGTPHRSGPRRWKTRERS
jgi:hypothetical protein